MSWVLARNQLERVLFTIDGCINDGMRQVNVIQDFISFTFKLNLQEMRLWFLKPITVYCLKFDNDNISVKMLTAINVRFQALFWCDESSMCFDQTSLLENRHPPDNRYGYS